MTVSRFDGNSLAGVLLPLFGADATMLRIECGACGSEGALAETVVERDDVVAIVRCRSCTRTLFTVTEDASGTRIRLGALGSFRSP